MSASIREIGRSTQGVRLINLGPKDAVMDVARVVSEDEEPQPQRQPLGQPTLDAALASLTTCVSAGEHLPSATWQA